MRTARVAIFVASVLVATGCSASGRTSSPSSPLTSVAAHSGSAVELVAEAAPSPPSTDASAESAVAGAEQGFGLRLLATVAGTDPGGNVTVSPLSLALALSMLETGAQGATLDQIATTLGTSSLSPVTQDEGWASLSHTLSTESRADGISLDSANSLWLQQSLPMEPQFMTAIARYFSSGVWQVDFAGRPTAAEAAINQWVGAHTKGRIDQLFQPGTLDRTSMLVLANAVYFQATWATPFDANDSQPGSFYLAPGGTSPATFMSGRVKAATLTSAYQAVDLPYAGGHYEAVVIMPRGQNLASFLTELSAGQLGQIAASADQSADVRLPRFTTQSYVRLNQSLATMGMPVAFTEGADFDGMSSVGLKVQSAVQRDYLSVGEKGTEAAAATGISMTPTVVEAPTGPTLTFDHPFLFVIRDTTTGALVFASVVQNPGS